MAGALSTGAELPVRFGAAEDGAADGSEVTPVSRSIAERTESPAPRLRTASRMGCAAP